MESCQKICKILSLKYSIWLLMLAKRKLINDIIQQLWILQQYITTYNIIFLHYLKAELPRFVAQGCASHAFSATHASLPRAFSQIYLHMLAYQRQVITQSSHFIYSQRRLVPRPRYVPFRMNIGQHPRDVGDLP